MTPTTAGVYLIGPDSFGPIKIGISQKIRERLRSMRSDSPLPLTCYVIGEMENVAAETSLGKRKLYSAVERRIHEAIKEYCLHGEWFDVSVLDILNLVTDIDQPLYFPMPKHNTNNGLFPFNETINRNISDMKWRLL